MRRDERRRGLVLGRRLGHGESVPTSGRDARRLVAELGSDVATLQVGEGGICAFSRSGSATCLGSVFGVPAEQYPAGPARRPRAERGARRSPSATVTCAPMGADGALRCWGANDFGQLANGTFVAHTAPALATALGGGSGGGGGGGAGAAVAGAA